MPGTMTESEHPMSLLSIEVLISDVQINLGIECHLPCMVFRLLDYPAVSIPYFDQWQLEEFHNLKREHPHVPWRHLLSDQFYELRSANGKFHFKRGKSCLFKTYLKTLYAHLLNVPLFLLLIDQINDKGSHEDTSQFIGSCNIKLNELIEMLNQSILRNGSDIPLVEQQTFHSTLFNLMGTPIGTCNAAVRFCHYGTTILTQLPMLDEQTTSKGEKKSPNEIKEQVHEQPPPPPSSTSPSKPTPPAADTVIKHIHFVNEKKDVGLQISRSEIPTSVSNHDKSAQTRWTSTKTHSVRPQHSKSRSVRPIEDILHEDLLISAYQPPPLYFNSNSDFLQMVTPVNAKQFYDAKENRLSYLASIPIASFNDNDIDSDDEDGKPQRPKEKTGHNVRFNLLSSPPITPRTQLPSKPNILTDDFLHNFPLLRALVEEAFALQQHQPHNIPIPLQRPIVAERPHSANQANARKFKQSLTRTKSAAMVRSTGTRSVIMPRNTNNNRRLYPPAPSKTNQMVVTKAEVRSLVDRLSKPKFDKRFEREIARVEQMTPREEPSVSPRPAPKPASAPTSEKRPVSQKPPLHYGTTRAHRLYAEYARARRATNEAQTGASPKAPVTSPKEPAVNGRIPPASPQLINTGTLSHLSLLNKVDIDTVTIERNSIPQGTSEQIQQDTIPGTKSSSTTSQDVSFELSQTTESSTTTSSSTSPTPTTTPTPKPRSPVRHSQQNDEKNDLGFSITDVTDYFTDGGNNSSARQSLQ
ncbi:unnamed protein product [Adineta ricciae]|nr:unnamed protein product [Adineta ricciae]